MATEPTTLAALQVELGAAHPPAWSGGLEPALGGCFVCFAGGGSASGDAGDEGWAAATVSAARHLIASAEVRGRAGAPYMAGLLAAREGPLLETAVHSLDDPPDLLMVNATGRDHPRRAGLALHLGWVLDIPTVGVTHRPLVASGPLPAPASGATSALTIDGEQVGWWFRTRSGARPVAVSPGWRVGLDTALEVMKSTSGSARTVEPIRQARRLARTARSRNQD